MNVLGLLQCAGYNSTFLYLVLHALIQQRAMLHKLHLKAVAKFQTWFWLK